MEHPRFADSVESFATNGAGKRNSTRTIASSGTTRQALRPKCADGISIKPSFTQLPTRDTDVPREHRHKACASQKKSWPVVTIKSLQFSSPEWAVYLVVQALPVMGFYRGPDPRKVDTSGVSYAAWVSVADVSASKVSGARRLHQECRLRVL